MNRFCNLPVSGSVRPLIETLEGRVILSASPAAAPAFATVSAPAAQASVAYPLGGNIQAQNEYTFDHGLVDLVKASTGFKSTSGGTVKTDANGWPTADFSISLWVGTVDVGRFNVSFNGPAGTTVALQAKNAKLTKLGYNAATGVHTYAIDVAKGCASLGLKVTNTGGQVKNLKVLQPGYSLSSYPTWSNKYVNLLKSLAPVSLRMMNIVDMNNNQSADWAQRPKTTDANYNRDGVPWEQLAQLCNQVGSSIWVCVPAHATDDYIRQLATVLKSTLNANLYIYIEYSNEVWNLAYEQGKYNYDQAQAEIKKGGSNLKYDGNSNTYDQGDRRTARRLKEIVDLFRGVWKGAGLPDPVNTRVRAVLGGQGPQLSRFDNMLKYIKDNYGAPNKWFYGIGIAPYFGMNKYKDNFVNGKWTTANTQLTADQVLEGMSLSVKNYESGVFSKSAIHGTPYGLKLEAYEGGIDTFGPFNIGAKKAASLDARIKPLIQRYLNAWYSQGGDVFNWLSYGARSYDTQYGTWSVTTNRDDLNQPKEQIIRTFRGLAPTA